MKFKEKDSDVDKISFNHGFDSSLSSSSELYPVGQGLTSSFLSNKCNFKKESDEFRCGRSDLYIFAGLGSISHDTRVIAGKKRRTTSQGSYPYDSQITENEDIAILTSSNIDHDDQEDFDKISEQHFQSDKFSGGSKYIFSFTLRLFSIMLCV